MKYYIYIPAVFLLALASLAMPAQAAGTSTDVLVPVSFSLSDAALATDNESNAISLNGGNIEILRPDKALVLWVPALPGNSSRLTALNDPKSGIIFRNNTMSLPLYNGLRAGMLIVTTDNLTADGEGYSGLITGLEIDLEKITIASNSSSFKADVTLILKDLLYEAAYRISFTNATPPEDISVDIEAAGLMPAAMSPTIEVEGNTEGARDAISFVFLTLETTSNWSQPYGSDNITFYSCCDRLYRLPFTTTKTAGGVVKYQAISPESGQFVIVATMPRVQAAQEARSAIPVDAAVIGGTLAVLVFALAVMVRRVAKR
jgi:hypothetical protein